MALAMKVVFRKKWLGVAALLGHVTCVAIIIAALIYPVALQAAGGKDGCNEWTVCEYKPPATPTSVPPTPTPRSSQVGDKWGLPVCTPSDQLRCKNQCHGTFGKDFWGCVDKCLSGSCAQSTSERPGSWAVPDDAMGCIEISSDECSDECRDQSGPSGARCRRACLEKRCPDANRLDVAKEGASPGAIRCDRCLTQYRVECRQMCLSGTWIAPEGAITGLGGMVCEKSCLSMRCGAGCGLGI